MGAQESPGQTVSEAPAQTPPQSAPDDAASANSGLDFSFLEPQNTGSLFDVIINGDEHGMSFDSQGKELMVKEIREGSQTTIWNMTNPDKEIKIGDSIAAVNGKTGTPGELVILLFALEAGRQNEL